MIAISFVLGALSSRYWVRGDEWGRLKLTFCTTCVARTGLDRLYAAFAGGSYCDGCGVGLGVLGLSTLFYPLFKSVRVDQIGKVITVLTGFSFGIFHRVVCTSRWRDYTKAKDALVPTLVGKVEAGIPEDHPPIPTIADNAGDNVGDVAGIGADGLNPTSVRLLNHGSKRGFRELPGVRWGRNAVCPLGDAPKLIPRRHRYLDSPLPEPFIKVKDGGDPHHALNLGEFISAGVLLPSDLSRNRRDVAFHLERRWGGVHRMKASSLRSF